MSKHYASQTTSATDSNIIQRSYLRPDDSSDYSVTMVSTHLNPDHGIILRLSNWLVLNNAPHDSVTNESAQSALTIETAKALVTELNRIIDSL